MTANYPSTAGHRVRTMTATGSTLRSDFLLIVDTTGGSFTVNLLTAVGIPGKFLHIKKPVGAGTVTIDAAGSETIDGALTQVLNTANSSICIVSDGANWRVV